MDNELKGHLERLEKIAKESNAHQWINSLPKYKCADCGKVTLFEQCFDCFSKSMEKSSNEG